MPGRSYRIGRIAGIPVGISPWWLVIVVLFTWTLGASYYPEVIKGIAPAASYALGLASVLLLFLSILAHEFGHALVARRHGIEIEEIDLWLLGGVSRMRGEAHEPGDELRYAIAGPAVTAVIGACFGAAALLLPPSTPSAVLALVEYEAFVNAAILVLNLMPAFPLDGGRVLRSLLWRHSGRLGPATERAAAIGRGFGYVMIALGLLEFVSGAPEGLWFALIGFFIVMAAGQQAMGAQLQEALSGVHAGELMSTPVISIPTDTTLSQAGRDWFARYRYTAFPVVDEQGRAVGLLDLPRLESREALGHDELPVGRIADNDRDLIVEADLDVMRLFERPAFARMGRAVVVDADGRPVGLVSITDVQRVLRTARLGAPRGAADGGGLAMGCVVVALLALAAAAAPGTARGAWSAARTVPGSGSVSLAGSGSSALVAGPGGETALVWRNFEKAGRPPKWWYDSSIHAAILTPTGRTVVRTVWRRAHSIVAAVTAVIDGRGELTVAWVEEPSPSGGAIVVRAVRRSPSGGWSPIQEVGRGATAFFYADPELAVSADGRVLLTWNAGSRAGVRAAWHSPGRAFGSVSTIYRSPAAPMLFPTPAFDRAGAAHVYGTVGCDSSRSRGVMLSTRPDSRRFGTPVVVAPPPAADLTASFAGGWTLLAWQHGECSTLEAGPGAPEARAMREGLLGAPVALAPHVTAYYVTPVAAGGGQGTVGWVAGPQAPGAQLSLMTAAEDGDAFGPSVAPIDGLLPTARDTAGDALLQDPRWNIGYELPGTAAGRIVAIQPAAGGALEAAPVSLAPADVRYPSLEFLAVLAGWRRSAAVAWKRTVTGPVSIASWAA